MEHGLKRAEDLIAQRHYAQACDQLRALVDEQPRLATARFLYSRALFQLGAFADAEQQATACFKLGSDKPDLLFGLARQLGNFLRLAEARTCLSHPRFRRDAPPAVMAWGTAPWRWSA